MATTTNEARSVDSFVRVGGSATTGQANSTAAVFRSTLTAPMSSAERHDAHLTLAAYARPGGAGFVSAPSAPARGIPVPTAGANRGSYYGNNNSYYGNNGYYGGAYVQPGYSTGYYGNGYYGGTGGGIFNWLFGGGAQIGVTIGPNGITAGITTGQILAQQAIAPYDCIVQDQYGRRFAVRYSQPIPPGYAVIMPNPDWWTWMWTPNLY